METATAVVSQKPKKVPSTLLIGVLIVLLIGTGLGVYFFTKPKKDDSDDESTTNNDEDDESGASGRTVTDTGFSFTAAQIAALLATPSVTPTPGTKGHSPTNPIFYKDPDFLKVVDEVMYLFQTEESGERMDIIRAAYNIGQGMMGRDTPEQECIEELFNKLPNVDFTSNPDRKYLAFPVYGTLELKGSTYRAELQNIINSGWEGLNLTRLRDDKAPWFCEEIGLNLLVGTTWSNTPTTHNVQNSFAPRSELNFFKKFNRYWVSDWHLADKYVDRRNSSLMVLDHNHPYARAAYCATGMFGFVQRWIAEIDRLDAMTRKEAYESLINSEENPTGTWYVTYINPETGVDEVDGQKGRN